MGARSLDEGLERLNEYRNEALLRRICGSYDWRYAAPIRLSQLSFLIAVLGIGSAIETPKDIFPYINIPVVTIVWNYAGLAPTEMAGRIVTVCERALTTTVNDIEHTESQSYQGVAIVKVYFQPGVQIAALPGAHQRQLFA